MKLFDLREIFGDMWSRINHTDTLRTRQFVPKKPRKAKPHVNHQARYKALRRASTEGVRG